MIVIGVDVHKHSLTAVAVDEAGARGSAWLPPRERQVAFGNTRAGACHPSKHGAESAAARSPTRLEQ